MASRDIIVIGSSVGGLQTLESLVRDLPSGFPAALFIVSHVPPGARSALPEILSRSGRLLATHPSHGDQFHPGQIYVAPPDHHMLLGQSATIELARSARENRHRPAIDPLFRTAARNYGSRVIGVILSGVLNDGVAGLLAVRRAGGTAVAQTPQDAEFATMPLGAASIAGVDYTASARELPTLLQRLVQELAPDGPVRNPPELHEVMSRAVDDAMHEQVANRRRGQLSTLTCPDCGGALWQVDDQGLIQFRCHVGHVFEAGNLLAGQAEALEAALWTSVRTFRERAVLASQIAGQERQRGNEQAATRHEEQAAQDEKYALLILEHVLKDTSQTSPQQTSS